MIFIFFNLSFEYCLTAFLRVDDALEEVLSASLFQRPLGKTNLRINQLLYALLTQAVLSIMLLLLHRDTLYGWTLLFHLNNCFP